MIKNSKENYKSQAPNHKQIIMNKTQSTKQKSLEFRNCNLDIVWNL